VNLLTCLEHFLLHSASVLESDVTDDFVTSLEYTLPMSKPEKTQQKTSPKGKPFAGIKRANIKALKLGLFNPTEELEKMNEGVERSA
jgi:hypothetical protein